MQREAEKPVRLGGGYGVLEEVGIGIAFPAKVEPGLRILVGEERIVPGDVLQPLILDHGPRPGFPGVGGYGVGRRPNREQVDHHELAVVLPAGGEEATFRIPAHGERLAAIEHPRPVNAFVDLRREVLISASWKYWRAVKTPQSMSEVSIDDNSHFPPLAPVFMSTKW